MYYHLNDHIYVTQFREELILMDTKKDKYTICFRHLSELLMNILRNNKSCSRDQPAPILSTQYSEDDTVYIQQLLNEKIKFNIISNIYILQND